MKRVIAVVVVAVSSFVCLSLSSIGQQAPPIPPVPGPGAAPQGGGGGGQGRGQQAQAPLAPVLQNYKPVTADRLKKPEDGDWLSVRRTYDGWGYSPVSYTHLRAHETPE